MRRVLVCHWNTRHLMCAFHQSKQKAPVGGTGAFRRLAVGGIAVFATCTFVHKFVELSFVFGFAQTLEEFLEV